MPDRLGFSGRGLQTAASDNEMPVSIDEPLLRRSDSTGQASEFDAAWLRFTNRPLGALLRQGWLQDVHPEDRTRCASINAEMLASREPYSLDYRLRHGVRGYRWVMDQARPRWAPDGCFEGFEHFCTDIHDRTELGERLASRLSRTRGLVRLHAAFSAALAGELDRLPPARVKAALETFAALASHRNAPHVSRSLASKWLGEIVADARVALPGGEAAFSLSLPPEPLEVDFDSTVLNAALTNALVCAALLPGVAPAANASRDETAQVSVERVGDTLLVELPASPGSSAFALLELALRTHGLSSGQVVSTHGIQRWRVALPLAQGER